MKTAILFGASGFVGAYLLKELLDNPEYKKVIIVVRKNLNIVHPKLTVIMGDYDSFPDFKQRIIGDDVFITLGISDYRLEHKYSVSIAEAAKENGAKSIFVITAVQADMKSQSSYVRVKGEIEHDITALNFGCAYFFRVSMLMGRKKKSLVEQLMAAIWTMIDLFLIGKHLERYKGISGEKVAKAMNNAAKYPQGGINICYWREMQKLLQ